MDDIILIGFDTEAIKHVLSALHLNFPLKDLGPFRFFLGLKIQTFQSGLHLSQTKYICDLLKKMNMNCAKSVISPMAALTQLSPTDGPLFKDPILYHNTVGSL